MATATEAPADAAGLTSHTHFQGGTPTTETADAGRSAA